MERINSSGTNSPYRLSYNSSVGRYQGSGLPAKYGTRYQTFTVYKPKKSETKSFGKPPKQFN